MTHQAVTPQAPDPKGVADHPDSRYHDYANPGVWRLLVLSLQIAVLVTSLFMGVIIVFDVTVPGGAWSRFGVLFFFVALEAVYTAYWLKHPDRRLTNSLAYRAAEIFLLAVLVRIYTWLVVGDGWPSLATLQQVFLNPAMLVNDPAFVLGFLITLLVWMRATSIAAIFHQLELSPAELDFYSLSAKEQHELGEDRPLGWQRPYLVESFLKGWIWGGVVLVVCTALSTIALGEIDSATNPFRNLPRLGLRRDMLLALLLYFLTGFWLLSQGRLSVMRARWLKDSVRRNVRIERTWRRYSLVLLTLVALVAAFLPIGSTLPIGRILGAVVAAAVYLYQVLFFALAAALFWLFSLFGRAESEGAPSERPVPPAFSNVTPQEQPPPPNEMFTIFVSSVAWTLFIVVTLIALGLFLRERGYRSDGRSLPKLWQTIAGWLRQMWWGLLHQARNSARILQAGRTVRFRKASSAGVPVPWRFLRLSALSPRQQIRYFYLSIVRRAGERGVLRRPGETPSEYIEDLRAQWPEAEEEVEALTGAFLKARYSADEIEKSAVNPVKATWKRIRANIQRR